MNIWILIWLLLSAALLYLLAWTLWILMRQKRAWSAFAAARKLRYDNKSFFVSPEMSGVLNGYTISLFTGEHVQDGARGGTRKMTAIEIQLSSRMPFEAAIASGGMTPLARGLNLKEEIKPADPAWKDSWIAAAGSGAALQEYMGSDRAAALARLMTIKNAWVMLAFKGEFSLLRLDTPDPLDHPKRIDDLLKTMIETAKILELKAGEEGKLKAAASRPVRATVAAPPKETGAADLSLEEE